MKIQSSFRQVLLAFFLASFCTVPSIIYAQSPGGVSTGLSLWLKADNGATPAGWADQSGLGNHALQATTADQPTITSNAYNFNPAVTFAQTQDFTSVGNSDNSGEFVHYDLPGVTQSVIDNTRIFIVGIKSDQRQSFGELGVVQNRGITGLENSATFELYDSFTENGLTGVAGASTIDELVIYSGFNVDTTSTSTSGNGPLALAIGRGVQAQRHLQGDIAEYILLSDTISATEVQRVESYLALKYGITLDQSTASNASNPEPGDYVSSTGVVIFDAHDGANNTYDNDIAGIGSDSGSDLEQRISRSVNPSAILTVATTNNFVLPNNSSSRTSLASGSFLVWGHDGGTTAFTGSYDGGANNRMDRIWRVSETNSTGTVHFAIPNSINFPGILPAIVISNDTTFDSTDTVLPLADNGQFLTASRDIANGQYFTFVEMTPLNVGSEVGTLDTKHFIPPIYRGNGATGTGNVNRHFLTLSTDSTTPFAVDISDGAASLGTVTISKAEPALINLSGGGHNIPGGFTIPANGIGTGGGGSKGLVVNTDLNLPNTNDGFVLSSVDGSSRFYASIRHSSDSQGGSLTAKGHTAVGTRFRSGHLISSSLQSAAKSHFISVMALSDDTRVTFSDFEGALTFNGTGINPFSSTIDLDEFESVVIAVELSQGSNNTAALRNSLNGTLVVSTDATGGSDRKLVVVNSGSFLGGNDVAGGGGRDQGFDQIIPTDYLGTDFVVGIGNSSQNATDTDVLERPVVVAEHDGTEIFVNGGAVSLATINAGEHFDIPGSNFLTDSMYIRTSQPAYLYQNSNSNTLKNGNGLNFIPSIFPNLETQEIVIPFANQLGAAFLNVIAPVGSTVDLNGVALTGASAITGNDEFEIYRVTSGVTNTQILNGTKPFFTSLGVASGNRGAAGFFVGFPNSYGIRDERRISVNSSVTIDVLDNDIKGFFDFSVDSITQPPNGTAVLNGDGTVTYTPNTDYVGADIFQYTIEDNTTGFQDTTFVSILVAQGPGGISNQLGLWLRAEDGSYNTGTTQAEDGETVETWIDQTFLTGDFVAASGDEAIFNENSANFHGGLTFANDDFLNVNEEIYAPDLSHEIYMVTSASGNVAWSQTNSAGTGKLLTVGGNYANNNNGSTAVLGGGVSSIPQINAVKQSGLVVSTYQNSLLQNSGAHLAGTAGIARSSIGGQDIGGHDVTGDILEFIAFNGANTTDQQIQIESYLALKYGITLDQSAATGIASKEVGDYLDSAGNIIFDAFSGTNNVYDNDIAGIGRDDGTLLDQKISKSVNADAVVAISLDNNFTDPNNDPSRLSSHNANLDFLLWGNDDGDLEFSQAGTPSNVDFILARTWQANEVGNVANGTGNVYVQFDISDVAVIAGAGTPALTDLFLLVDADADFGTGADTSINAHASSDLANGIIVFEVPEASLEDAEFFTLGCNIANRVHQSPGGIFGNLELWLRAGSGIAVSNGQPVPFWDDQSRADNDAAQLIVNRQPILNTTGLNFNSVVDFDGLASNTTGDLLTVPNLNLDDTASIYYVMNREAQSGSGGSSFRGVLTTNTGLDGGGGIEGYFVGIERSDIATRGVGPIDSAAAANFIAGPNPIELTPLLVSFSNNAGAIEQFENAASVGTDTINFTGIGATGYAIGGDVSSSPAASTIAARHLRGEIAEVIAFDDFLSGSDHIKVESYLAIKYGITLDQSGADGTASPEVGDYLDSTGNVVFDAFDGANNLYDNDIAGIGRDYLSSLDQRISKSINSDAVVAMALDNDFVSANDDLVNRPTAHGADLDFLFWGNDDGDLEFTQAGSPSNVDFILERTWQAQETGDVADGSGNVYVQFDISNVAPIAGGGTPALTDLFLLVDANADFATGADTSITAHASSNVAAGLIVFEVPEASLEDAEFFTLGCNLSSGVHQSPGGVLGSLALWLKADGDVYNVGTTAATDGETVETWVNSIAGGAVSDVNQSSTLGRPIFDEKPANFNPALQFDGQDDFLDDTSAPVPNSDEISVFLVYSRDVLTSNAGTGSGAFSLSAGFSNRFNVQLNRFSDDSFFDIGGTTGAVGQRRRGANPVPLNQFGLVSAFNSVVGSDIGFSVNNINITSAGSFGSGGTPTEVLEITSIGRAQPSALEYFSGHMSEVVVYGEALDSIQTQQVESYLALKYGITLDQSGATGGASPEAGDYVDSSGNVIFDAHDGTTNNIYDNDIAGIGRDDFSMLDQRVSKSVNVNAVVTVALENDFISPNTGRTQTHSADKEFLLWGNNNQDLEFTQAGSPSNVDFVLERTWQAQETGDVADGSGNIYVQFDISNVAPIAGGGTPALTDLFLLVDANANFTSGSDTSITAHASSNIAAGLIVFEVPEASLEDAEFFTLGCNISSSVHEAPGGVGANIALWLSADVGGAAWSDRSGNGTILTPVNTPTLSSDLLNFNPQVSFNDSASFAYYNLSNAAFENGAGDKSIYVVANRNANDGAEYLVTLGNTATGSRGVSFGHWNSFPGSPFTSTSGLEVASNDTAWSVGESAIVGHSIISSTDALYTNGRSLSINEDDYNLNLINGNVGRIGNFIAPTVQGNWDGEIAEVIVYNSGNNSNDERLRIESYLAIKYGITLDQSVADGIASREVGDYLDSAGNIIFDAFGATNNLYDNDIAGIGRDDAATLDQRVSRSENADAVVAVALDNNFTDANNAALRTSTHSADKEFLLWGNNDDPLAFNQAGSPSNVDFILERTWQASETGEVANAAGNVYVQFDISNVAPIAGAGTPALTDLFLLVDSDANFVTGADTTITAFSYSNDVVVFEVPEASLENGEFFTLGCNLATGVHEAPGGVGSNLNLWLKADAGVLGGVNVNTWEDQSGNEYDFSQVSGGAQPDSTVDSINFNPSLTFNGSSDVLRNTVDPVYGVAPVADLNVFAVYAIDTASNRHSPFGGSNGGHTRVTHVNADGIFGDAQSNGGTNRISEFSGISPAYQSGVGFITTFNHQTTGSALQEILRNGLSVASDSTAIPFNPATNAAIGSSTSGLTELLQGNISELIVYPSNLTDEAKRRIHTYLAVKYGITLDQSTASNALDPENGDYVDSVGNVIFDAHDGMNNTFDNDIIGIGRDDASVLDQRISKSVNTTGVLTIASGTDADLTNNPDPRTGLTAFSDNLDFLVIGNNGQAASGGVASTAAVQAINVNSAGTTYEVLRRVWQANNTGSVGATSLEFDLGGISNVQFNNAQLALLKGTDPTFATAASTTITTANITISGSRVNITGVTLADGEYFTLALQQSPNVDWATASQSQDENDGNMSFNATLNYASNLNVGVTFSVDSSSTAATPSDYSITSSPVTISAASTTQAVTITVSGDTDIEADETVVIDLDSATNANVSGTTRHTATITNDDSAVISIAASDTSGVENSDDGEFRISTSIVIPTATTISYTITGSASGGSDYTTLTGSVILPASTASVTLNVDASAFDDSSTEGVELVVVTLTAENSADAALSSNASARSATVSIIDDDTNNTCGNGTVEFGESCDDGGTVDGDGCDANCAMEPGSNCTGSPSICSMDCGDGVIDAGEQCDDDNTIDLDGCSSSCTIESPYVCTGEPSVCTLTNCGNGLVEFSEECDDGANVNGDGCDSTCTIEPGSSCTGEASLCTMDCGDGMLDITEACDDGNSVNGDGCDSKCAIEPGNQCTGEPSTCVTTACGNGIVEGIEECDDSNSVGGDGCDNLCEIEPGYVCLGSPSDCNATCGDGNLDAGETCDDLNYIVGDGCDAECQIESGATCDDPATVGGGSTCSFTSCGNGIVEFNEACDDGNNLADDGCNPICVIEPGESCTGSTSVCTDSCGDGVVDAGEECDDENVISDDGCSAACTIEPGNTCTGEPSVCNTTACGNGAVEFNEACDDGNNTSGDGCDAACAVESPYVCTNSPSICSNTCGNGDLDTGEACDDGNNFDNDGCSAACLVEPGNQCMGEPSVCSTTACGDGIVDFNEECDDGNTTPFDGCDNLCAIETGSSCLGSPSLCTSSCGDGVVDTTEACDDDNNLNGDGCSATCTVEPGNQCMGEPSVCTTTACGDGAVTGVEECDDGNTVGGDGCDSVCEIEPGAACTGIPSVCANTCGDGIVDITEECDDSNTAPGDGCSAACTVEPGEVCTGEPSVCSAAGCGNGLVEFNEACDDGNNINGDGCNAACVIEPGSSCTNSPSICVMGCGDGVLDLGETCDDGNLFDGDGCNAACQVESPYVCVGVPSVCTTAGCGNGIVDFNEECDDGNNTSTDGCDAGCQIEPGASCTGSPMSTCSSSCGDGVIDATEECDDDNLFNGDGCSEVCEVEPGNECMGEPSVCSTANCGNGTLEGAEECDDGLNLGGDGCDALCQIEPGYMCFDTPSICSMGCGNGTVDAGEECDDGDTMSGDGCSLSCEVEPGFMCMGNPSTCDMAECGDGYVDFNEPCDDGNNVDGDGCDATCMIEPGNSCVNSPSICTDDCGDGVVDAGEECDDGDNDTGDGCSAVCQIEPGNQCVGEPSVCSMSGCGNAVVELNEECDDGNNINGDGCNSSCVIESVSSCTGSPSVCAVGTCGDGTVDQTEACDDGNNSPGDGCDAVCRIEPGSSCIGSPSVCTMANCGDGFVTGIEECDDGNMLGGDGCDNQCVVEPETVCIGSPSVCLTSCGDGTLDSNEECDDDNFIEGDGCDASCKVEPGYVCDDMSPTNCDTTNCGDGVIDFNEECDDSNTAAGDGCSATCTVESPYVCMNEPSICFATCGNGALDVGEECDDANLIDDDGCSSTCLIEPGSNCDGEPSDCNMTSCGDGLVAPNEACDDGNTTSGDGCNNICAIEPGSSCIGSPSICSNTCGDGVVNLTEECDDFNLISEDGCSATCTIEPGNQCTGEPSICTTAGCGDGVIAGIEECDDGNAAGGDGCDSVCEIEPGSSCTGTPSVCTNTCGDGVIDISEECDDANTAPGDGCSATCTVEPGEVCTGEPSVCSAAGCGNGLVEFNEECDDGNNTNGDGCNAACVIEPGSSCTNSPSICVMDCGDGLLDLGETCDDGNLFSGDGCDSVCQVEPGEVCTGEPSVCTSANCGDGVVDFNELCDDGNNASLDGCDAACQIEPGSSCSGLPMSTCSMTCGDGVVDATEECDDGNLFVGDGCDAICMVEPGNSCVGMPSVCSRAACGNGVLDGAEECDDSNTVGGDGCDNLCEVEPGYICVLEPSECGNDDTDNDGIPNSVECPDPMNCRDSDGDGRPDIVDLDSDNDTIPDNLETSGDADGDGFANYRDSDSDDDGVLDIDESTSSVTTGSLFLQAISEFDGDNDGRVDDINDENSNFDPVDSDGDGVDDYLDLDSDGDCVPDNTEGQLALDFRAPSGNDSDGDGVDDSYDVDDLGAVAVPDTDSNGLPDFRDDDSDGDSLSDFVEVFDIDGDGTADTTPSGLDLDLNGWDDACTAFFNSSGFVIPDRDGDGIPDFADPRGVDGCEAMSQQEAQLAMDGAATVIGRFVGQARNVNRNVSSQTANCSAISQSRASSIEARTEELYILIWSLVWNSIPSNHYVCEDSVPIICEDFDLTNIKTDIRKNSRKLFRQIRRMLGSDCVKDSRKGSRLITRGRRQRNRVLNNLDALPQPFLSCQP